MTDIATYKLNHTMIPVSDPDASLKFYQHLGMSILEEYKFPDYQLDLYFLAFDGPGSISHGKQMSDREGVLELSHSYGIKPMYNEGPKSVALSCISLSVDNLAAACNRLTDAGYKLIQEPDGNVAIALDPDEYWIKLIAQCSSTGRDTTLTNVQTYKLYNTMLHVQSTTRSLEFYTKICGMKLTKTAEHVNDGSTSYFLGYSAREPSSQRITDPYAPVGAEGLLELIWLPGTEKQGKRVFHDGTTQAGGFGHICISVDDIASACERLAQFDVSWKKRLLDGPFRVAFITDPDGYEVEIIQNEKYKPANHG
ncbi:related to GLO1 - glyoxalase I [Fusarium torulosum]|uniref:Related to GLO1 - glyoxalase I n=1 Tax=Fusarium torulosum TaxID=33205 RepID=A0AAE8MM98_9HYPO|nr:related to GLO1 - glyoxalase I [Fusarium torulosum]